MGGMVLETNMTEILLRIEEQSKIEKEEVLATIYLLILWTCKIGVSLFLKWQPILRSL
jgi:hypothetical protein